MSTENTYKRYPSKGEYPAEVDDVVLACYDAVIDPENEERCLKPERYAELSVNDLSTTPYWYHAHDEDGDEVDEPDWWIGMPRNFNQREPNQTQQTKPRFCVDCNNHGSTIERRISLITGKNETVYACFAENAIRSCEGMRDNPKLCGPDAKLFEAKGQT